jgi:hypothetical protein
MRKRVLVMESELNRLTLRTEWRHLGAATGWLGRAARFCREANPWLALLAPLAGMFLGRAVHREGGFLRKLFSAARWLPALLAVWRNLSGTQSEPNHPK